MYPAGCDGCTGQGTARRSTAVDASGRGLQGIPVRAASSERKNIGRPRQRKPRSREICARPRYGSGNARSRERKKTTAPGWLREEYAAVVGPPPMPRRQLDKATKTYGVVCVCSRQSPG